MSVLPVLVFIEKSQLIPFVEALLRPHAVEVHGRAWGSIPDYVGFLRRFIRRPCFPFLGIVGNARC